MDFLISAAAAQQSGADAPGLLGSFLPLIIIFALFYFLFIRPQMKRAKDHRKMVSELAAGDEVVTAGGLLGRITEVGDSFVTVEFADGIRIKLQKQSVSNVVPKGTFESAE